MKALEDFPRATLGHLPTPLEAAPRLSAALGDVSVYIKRDDCTGLAVGGNKTRKLEFLVGDALASGADTLLSFGALQSNHARQTAAAAARAGLRCHLVLVDKVKYREPAYETSGNLLLDHLLGADVHIVKTDAEAVVAASSILEEEAAAQRQVYAIPTGGSNDVGALGYVACALELLEQSAAMGIKLGAVVTAVSSAGTLAGLVAGFAAVSADVHVIGVNVYKTDRDELAAQVEELVAAVAEKIEAPKAASDTYTLVHDFLGEGYGIPTDEMLEAVELVACSEGVLLDPVYTGKAMAALIALSKDRDPRFDRSAEPTTTVFLHTGGSPGLFAYRDALSAIAGD